MAARKPRVSANGAPELSRTALEQFLRCPRCFYLQRRLGVKPPAMVPLTLAVATDALLKNEFDAVRASGTMHPLWLREGLNVRAYVHPEIDTWRSNFKGIRAVHAPTGATISGAIDDVWQHRDSGALHIVDYKSTSKQGTPALDGGFGDSYKRQMEIYQWLFRQAGFEVSATGYFLYVNASKQGGFYGAGLDGTMRFETTLIAYEGDTAWVDEVIAAAVQCFGADVLPASGSDCDACRYYSERSRAET